jgi:putative two-component system response regulator
MKKHNEKLPELDSWLKTTSFGEDSKLVLDYFADQIDNEIQNHLISELMARYADISQQLAQKNSQLQHYSGRLEEMVQKKVMEISASQMSTIRALVKAAEARDDDTGTHIERTSMFCKIIAERLYENKKYPDVIDAAYAENISKASPLHDVGKIGIRDAILLKPGRLTPEEFEIMKTHVTIGQKTLLSAAKTYPRNVFLKIGIEIADCHHEKWDGSGYMSGLSGKNIPISARIMAVSDVYDALRSKRVYKEPFSHEKTCGIILEGRGSHFDPALVDIFEEHHSVFEEIYDRLSAKKD